MGILEGDWGDRNSYYWMRAVLALTKEWKVRYLVVVLRSSVVVSSSSRDTNKGEKNDNERRGSAHRLCGA